MMKLGNAPLTVAPDAAPAEGEAQALHRESVAELVRQHDRALHMFLMARVRDEAEAREVAQEAYVRMLQLAEPGAVSFLRAYLFRIAANVALNRAKQRAVRARLLLAAGETVDRADELSPDRWALSAEDVQVLKRALLELSPKCRGAFLLCRLEGFSDVQAAAHLGISPRMVRHYLAEAGQYCQARIEGRSADEARESSR